MDLLETTAASYQAIARLATFVQVHQPSKKAYLDSLRTKPTKNDMGRLTKELETLRLFGEEMEQEVRLMGAPPKEGELNVESTGEEDR